MTTQKIFPPKFGHILASGSDNISPNVPLWPQEIQYIPWIIHMVCTMWFGFCSILPISFKVTTLTLEQSYKRPVGQIPQCTDPISHNTPLCNRNVHMRVDFCYNKVHWHDCGIFFWCSIVGFVRWISCPQFQKKPPWRILVNVSHDITMQLLSYHIK